MIGTGRDGKAIAASHRALFSLANRHIAIEAYDKSGREIRNDG